MKLKTILLTLVLLFVCAAPTFAASAPHINGNNSTGQTYDNFIVFYYPEYDLSMAYTWLGTGSVSFSVGSDNSLYMNSHCSSGEYVTLTYWNYEGGQYVPDSNFVVDKTESESMDIPLSSVVYSSSNILDSSGNVVFPGPPTLEGVVAEEMNNFQITVGGMMKTLVLCGVGCLALLISLKLFGKVLPIFRV